MFIVNILALIIVILALAIKFNRSMVETLPVAVCLLTLCLYILAFFDSLWISDVLGISILLYYLTKIVRASKEEKNLLKIKCIDKLKAPSFWVFTGLMILVAIGVASKMITWWDDYNFWATDVKAIYLSDGFAAKYHNVQPEFGDYPPATQLIKWFFLHMNPNSFNEGLMFTGYYFMLFSFIAPLLKFFDDKKIYVSVMAGILMILFPATVEAFHLDGCCADICMAACFGYFLISLYEIKSNSETPTICDECRKEDCNSCIKINKSDMRFLLGRCALILCVMSLCKNTSFIWLGIAFVITLIFIKKDKLKTAVYIFVPPAVSVGSWYVYCLINRRVAKLVSNSLKMATGQMGLPEYRGELLDSFFEAFLKWPLNRYSQGLINLSPLALILLMTAGFVLLGVFKKISKQDSIYLAVICPAMGLVITGILLVSHLTIFATEDQYLEPFAMVSSIERYGAPFGIGMLMLLIYLILQSAGVNTDSDTKDGATKKYGNGSVNESINELRKSVAAKYAPYMVIAAFILLTTDYISLYRGYWGYRTGLPEITAEREGLINQDIISLNKILDNEAKIEIGRVLYVRDFSDLSWISHAYISYAMAPLSVVYEYVDDLAVPVREASMRGLAYQDENGYKEENTGMGAPAGFGGGTVAQNAENGYDALLRRANELHADYIYMDRKLYSVR